MKEEEIIDLIRKRKYSRLLFLEDEEALKENNDYYGFLYFVLNSKKEKTSKVLDGIIKKHGGRSKAYEYLGKIAKKVYYEKNVFESYIPEGFFRASLEVDHKNSESWWELFLTTHDANALLESLKIDYNNEKFELISKKINRRFSELEFNFSVSEWNILVEIMSNKKSLCHETAFNNFLIAAYFYLKEFDRGIGIIHSFDKVYQKNLMLYYKENKLDRDIVLSKMNLDEKEKFLGDDHESIYQEYLAEEIKREEVCWKKMYPGGTVDEADISEKKFIIQKKIEDKYVLHAVGQGQLTKNR